jgi:ACS family tartrate transporter-like MFS transporter
MTPTAEQTTMRKVYLRLLPFSILCMFVCYLDRVNVGFAALTMNKDLGFSAYLFGLGAGAFYGGYCLFEVPSNLVQPSDRFSDHDPLCRRHDQHGRLGLCL